MDGVPTGVWVHQAGPRIEVTEHDGGWRITVFQRRGDRDPGAIFDFPQEQAAEVRTQIRDLQTQGYIPRPDATPGDDPSPWNPVAVVAVAIIVVLLLTTFISMR